MLLGTVSLGKGRRNVSPPKSLLSGGAIFSRAVLDAAPHKRWLNGIFAADTPQRVTLGTDKGYDTAKFRGRCGGQGGHPARGQNSSGRRSAIDGRTTRHPGYTLSQRIRKRVDETNRMQSGDPVKADPRDAVMQARPRWTAISRDAQYRACLITRHEARSAISANRDELLDVSHPGPAIGARKRVDSLDESRSPNDPSKPW